MRHVTKPRMLLTGPRAGVIVALAAGAGACSLVNSYADLKPQADAGVVDATQETGTDGGTTESSAGEGGASDGTSSETGNPEAGFPDKGAVVISGRVADDAGNLQGVLTAINPVDGTELPKARQGINVPVVLYDGLRDLWYVISTDGSSLFPTPTDHALLQIRTLNPSDGTWVTLQSLSVPPPVFGLVAVTTNRVLYVGFDSTTDAASGTSLVTIDTSDPSAPNIYGTTALPELPFGLIGTRSTTGNGGPVNMLVAEPCPDDGGAPVEAGASDGGDGGVATDAGGGIGGGECLIIQHVTVPTDPDPATLEFVAQLGPFFGRPAFGSFITGGPEDVILWSLPGGNPGAPGATSIHTFSPLNEAPVGTPISIQTSDGFFQPFAFAECQQQALLTATNEDLAVYSIPLAAAAGQTARAATTHSGQGVYFEPYTSTVLSPFTQGDGYVLTAFTLGGTQANPTLTPRQTGWTPPADVRPEVIAVRNPLPIKCPP